MKVRIERGHVNPGLFPSSEIHEVLTVGQKAGPQTFSIRTLERQYRRLAAAGRDLIQVFASAGGKNNHSRAVPGPTSGSTTSHRVWDRPAGSIDLFSLPLAKNPIDRLSGDQNGYAAPSVPASAWGSGIEWLDP